MDEMKVFYALILSALLFVFGIKALCMYENIRMAELGYVETGRTESHWVKEAK